MEEILPGVYFASSLIRAEIGVCPTSVINTTETDMTIALPLVTLEVLYTGECALTLTTSADFSGSSTLFNLHNHLRLGYFNSEERQKESLVSLCEKFSDLFHVLSDILTCTTTIEHAILTPTVDPHRTINARPYKLSDVHKKEIRKQTEQLLADEMIQHCTIL
jgi:hypothetical protein